MVLLPILTAESQEMYSYPLEYFSVLSQKLKALTSDIVNRNSGKQVLPSGTQQTSNKNLHTNIGAERLSFESPVVLILTPVQTRCFVSKLYQQEARSSITLGSHQTY